MRINQNYKTYHVQKSLKFPSVFYLNHSTKIAKAGPEFDDRLEHLSVQVNSSNSWIKLANRIAISKVIFFFYYGNSSSGEINPLEITKIVCIFFQFTHQVDMKNVVKSYKQSRVVQIMYCPLKLKNWWQAQNFLII